MTIMIAGVRIPEVYGRIEHYINELHIRELYTHKHTHTCIEICLLSLYYVYRDKAGKCYMHCICMCHVKVIL